MGIEVCQLISIQGVLKGPAHVSEDVLIETSPEYPSKRLDPGRSSNSSMIGKNGRLADQDGVQGLYRAIRELFSYRNHVLSGKRRA
jgi:hypothetical protein